MAATYTVLSPATTFLTTNKVLLQLYKDATATTTMKIYRVYIVSTNISAVTGVLPIFLMHSHTTLASVGSPTTLTAIKHDTNSATITSGSGGWTINTGNTTLGGGTTNALRRWLMPSDEFAASTAKIENIQGILPYSVKWDNGYGDTRIEPLTFPASTAGGISIYNAGITGAAGSFDIAVEFTVE